MRKEYQPANLSNVKRGSLRVCCAGAVAVTLGFSAPAFAQTDCEVTLPLYSALQPGMTVQQVSEILGCPGVELSRSDMAGFTTIMLMWDGNSFGGNMNVMFQNDALITKAQFGLK